MEIQSDEPRKLTRDCQVVAVPAGHTVMLPQGTEVMITQSLGGSYTVMVPSYGGLFRLADRDADALGVQRSSEPPKSAEPAQPLSGETPEVRSWARRTQCQNPH